MVYTMADEKEEFCCEKCSFATNKRNNLVKHVRRIHLNIKDHKCELCDHSAFSRNDLTRHIKNMHLDKIGMYKYECHKCDYSTTLKCSIETHKNSHSAEKQEDLKCTECAKSYSGRDSLVAHVRATEKDQLTRPFAINVEAGRSRCLNYRAVDPKDIEPRID